MEALATTAGSVPTSGNTTAQAPALPPGPRLPRALQAVMWGLRYPQFTQAAHVRYGRTFTIRAGTYPPAVVTTDRDAIRRLFTGDPLGKRHGNEPLKPMIGDRSVLLLEPAAHLERRKLLLPPFHGERVRAYTQLMQSLVDAELDNWREGRVVTVRAVAQNLTLEIILQAVLGIAEPVMRRQLRELIDDLVGYPLNGLRRRLDGRFRPRRGPGSARGRLPELAAALAGLPTPAVATYFPELKTRTRWNALSWRWWTLYDQLLGLLDEQIATTRADPQLAERSDILAMLVQARDERGNGFADEDLRDELVALIAAGHETTATAIAWGAQLLAHNPPVRERAARAAADGDGDYLDALVKEVLRVRPPLPLAAGRVLYEPFEIGPHTIPAGVHIFIDSWGLHHDPALYPDPDNFRPERFIGQAPEPYTWLPFGGGAHRCIGAGLAELEIKTALASILRRIDLQPAAPAPEFPIRRAVTLVPHQGGRVKVATTLRSST